MSYTRWGRTTCPTTEGTQLVYEGAVVGNKFDEPGAEFLCLHKEPEFLQTTPGVQGGSVLYGSEFRNHRAPHAFANMLNHDPPCSVCYTPSRSTKITIPGRVTCPDPWTREYYGYYMSGRSDAVQKGRVPICVDVNAESVPGSAARTSTSVLVFLEATCTGISYPPYSDGAEVACVVCTI